MLKDKIINKLTKINESIKEEKDIINKEILMKVDMDLNFNNECLDLIDKNLKGDISPIEIFTENNYLYAKYNGAVIAEDISKKKFTELKQKVDDYSIQGVKLNVSVPMSSIQSEDNSEYEDIFKKANKINYSMEKINYMINCNVGAKLINRILEVVEETNRVDVRPETLYIEEENKIKAGLVKVINNGSLRLFGPKSCGKNTFVDTLAWLLERKVYKFSSNPQADKSDLIGDTELVTVKDDNGNTHVITEFKERILIRAMKEGCIILFDEINCNDIGLLSCLHGPLDDTRTLSSQSGEIKAKPGFLVIATMNENYIGTSELNPALVDRMLGIEFKAPETLKKVLLAKRPTAPKEILEYIDTVYKKILSLMQDELCDDSPFSIRGFIDTIDLYEYGFEKKEAISMSIVNRIQDTEYREVIKNSLNIC